MKTIDARNHFSPRLRLTIAAHTYFLILFGAYVFFVNPLFEYAGFALAADVFKLLEVTAIYSFLICVLRTRVTYPSDVFSALLVFIAAAPLLIFYATNTVDRLHLYTIILPIIAIILASTTRPKISISTIKLSTLTLFLSYLTLILVVGYFVGNGLLRNFNLDFDLVYEFRQEIEEQSSSRLFAYIQVWSAKVLGPFLLAIALYRRSVVGITSVICFHAFLFGVSSHKSVLFYPLVVVGIWFWLSRSSAVSYFVWLLSLVVLSSTVWSVFTESLYPATYIIRRVLFVPAQLNFSYLEYFSINGFVWWSNSVLSAFIEYPFDQNYTLLIGEFTGSGAFANNMFLATGYMHAGIFGVFLYSLIFSFTLRFIDSVAGASRWPLWISVSLVVVPIYTIITSADLLTGFTTHGLALALFLLCFFTIEVRSR